MEESQNPQAYRIFVEGRVQGVGYRRFAQQKARVLNLEGWTRNLSDGRVEIYVWATSSQLEIFQRELIKGPAHGRVVNLMVEEATREEAEGFSVRADA